MDECYTSVNNQELVEEVEIILVDDGSTDGSGKICDKYASNKNTYVFHKENGGLSSARNYGLSKSKGEYITFVDSDDRINTQSLKDIIEHIRNISTDLIFVNIDKFYKDGTMVDIGDNIEKTGLVGDKNECIEHLHSRPKFPASACGKVFRKAFLDKNDISFPKDRRVAEDMGFMFRCMMLADTFDKIDVPFYYYRQNRENSITSQISMKSFRGVGQFIVDSLDMYSIDRIPNDTNAKLMFNFLAYEYSILLWQYGHLDKADKKEAYDFLKQFSFVMKWGRSRKSKVIRLLMKLFGIKFASTVVRVIKK